jgi:glycerol-1-phosphate dehydrogenase [NAD(P)+]
MSADRIKVLKPGRTERSRWMQLPRDVVIGHETLAAVPAVCTDLRLGDSALVVTGSHTRDLAGRQVADELAASFSVDVFVAETISMDVIREAEKAAKKADFLIGVGGGRVIDTAKIVSYNMERQFISVPTAASHDGIVSARASVPMEEGSASLAAHPPIAIVADTGIIASSPHRLTASGCADIISNWTACLDWELANRLKGEQVSDYAIALSRMTAELLKKNTRAIRPHSEEGAWIVIKALVSSGVAMSIAGSSRPGSGGEHKFGHALERLIPGKALHGEACGIGTIISMYLHGGDWRGIREALKYIGAPVTPGDLGIPDEVAVEALIAARHIRPERFTIIDMGITRESAEKLIRMLYED